MKLIYLLIASTVFTGASAQKDSLAPKVPQAFTFVEQMPEFPGGDAAMVKFLKQNVTYPQMEHDNHIEGKVLLRFVITEDGSVGEVQVVRGVSPGLDKEALRVVKKLPRFKPGMNQGKPVKVYYNLPIFFKPTTVIEEPIAR
jgi:protein TonB